jgi:hypothetical protein
MLPRKNCVCAVLHGILHCIIMRMTSFLKCTSRVLPILVACILVLMPFHAFLSVWVSQLVSHYTAVRLWKEFLLVVLTIGAGAFVSRNAKIRRLLWRSWLVRLMVAYLVLQIVGGLVAYAVHTVSLIALGYGLISNMRFFVFFLAVVVTAHRAPLLRDKWQQLLLWPLAIVVAIGLLQYFILPYDFLKHFGYGNATIFPYEDINSNLHYIRVMSTLRGANPLGAYLVAMISLLCAWRRPRQWWWYALLSGSLIVLVLTFSRGAWIGLACSLALFAVAYLGNRVIHIRFAVGSALVLGMAVGIGFGLYRNTTFQNIFLHTQSHSVVQTTSNQGHESALQHGLADAIHEPLGRGPGTAGPASVYNTGHQSRIAENYFIQIAQETGWVGLALFVVVNSIVGAMLWIRRRDPLAFGLCLGLVGLSVVNFFSHAWADDTLAYLWWGLAAIALAPAILQPEAE